MLGCSTTHIQRCLRFYGIKGHHGNSTAHLRQLDSKRIKKLWEKDKKYRERVLGNLLKTLDKRPNRAEQTLIDIIQRNNLPFEYVGDGKVIISGLVPDFINTNGRKELIELFGEYWHTIRATRPTQTEHGRGAIFKKFGYRTLIIWEKELEDESQVVAKIKNFMR